LFKVAIVGRPNVGKSTLFNRLTRTRKALVGDEPGITRDRIFYIVREENKAYQLVDTGGIIPGEKDFIPEKVFEQAEIAIEEADLILFIVDARAGVTPLDQEVAALLKSSGREVVVIANKIDGEQLIDLAYAFYELGIQSVLPFSAEHNLGTDNLRILIEEKIPEGEITETDNEVKISIIGRPNVGKSSVVNRLLGFERVIVSDIPGTTRDSIDSLLEFDSRKYRLIDTAGIRRKGKTDLMAEKLSVVMARKNLERSDVVILIIDATEGATKLDATIGGYAHEAGKPIIIAVNKWDLIEKDTYTANQFEQEYRSRMKFLDYAQLLFISAKTGQRVTRVLDLANSAFDASRKRIPTGELNSFLRREIALPIRTGGQRKNKSIIKYGCQIGISPPTFMLFLRGSKGLHFSRVRYLTNQLREHYGFIGTPIRILQRTSTHKRVQSSETVT
jgi:GTP-binding protein